MGRKSMLVSRLRVVKGKARRYRHAHCHGAPVPSKPPVHPPCLDSPDPPVGHTGLANPIRQNGGPPSISAPSGLTRIGTSPRAILAASGSHPRSPRRLPIAISEVCAASLVKRSPLPAAPPAAHKSPARRHKPEQTPRPAPGIESYIPPIRRHGSMRGGACRARHTRLAQHRRVTSVDRRKCFLFSHKRAVRQPGAT
jgi:hypothetical protein